MTEYELIEGKPRIFAISQNNEMLSTVEEYVDNYDYDYVGSASNKSDIFKKVEELSVNLIFLDSEIEDIDLIEANEAFAAQSVAVAKDLGFDMEKVNVNGGAIALGHPIGASGARILVTLIYEMIKRDSKTGMATLCIGGGQGTTVIVER